MEFKFNKEASKILDYLMFPRMIFKLEEAHQRKDDLVKSVVKDDFKELVERLHNDLEPFRDEILQFYQLDIYSNYDFANILLDAYSIYDYQDIHDYLDDLLKEEPQTLKEKIIKSIISMEDEAKSLEELNELDATKYINQLKIDSANKWNLFMLIQEPHEHLQKYISLLKKVEPFFKSSFKLYEKQYNEVGKDLAKRLSVDTNETFKKITFDTVSYDFSSKGTCNLYISFVMPYSLRLSDRGAHRVIWGLDMEYAFKKMNELNEDNLARRVKIFKALGDKTRYEVLRLIAKGVTSIKKIAESLDVSSATISYHVNEFLNTGIVYLNKSKNQKIGYKIDYKRLNEVFNDFKEDLNFSESGRVS